MAKDRDEKLERPSQELARTTAGVMTIGGARAVVMTDAAQVFLMRTIHEHAPHIIKYAFYDMGYEVGRQLMDVLKSDGDDPETSFRRLVENYRQMGYGELEVAHFDLKGPEARLVGRGLFETVVARQAGIFRTPRSVDHYSRGMFAGFLSSLLGREVVCEEVACQFRGDANCEFVVLPFEGLRSTGPISQR